MYPFPVCESGEDPPCIAIGDVCKGTPAPSPIVLPTKLSVVSFSPDLVWEGGGNQANNELVLDEPSGEYNEAVTTEMEEGLFVLGMSEAEKWSGGGILWNGGIIKCLLPDGDAGLGRWSVWLSIIAGAG